LPGPGERIQTSDYSLDLFQGPVLAGSRITGLAGAYSALAEGAEGHSFNAAAPVVRTPYSMRRTDWDATAGVTFPSSVSGTDFDNNGRTGFTYGNFVFLTAGGQIQDRRAGVGATVNLQQYQLSGVDAAGVVPNEQVTSVVLRYGRGNLVGGYSFFDDQLYVGGGLRAAVLALVDSKLGAEKELFSATGFGAEAGAVWAPKELPVRTGLTLRTPAEGKADPASRIGADQNGDRKIGSTFLPSTIFLPWEIEAGAATQLGPRPLNPGWTNPESFTEEELAAQAVEGESRAATAKRLAKLRYDSLPRKKLLITSSVLITGPTKNAVGFESFLAQQVDRSGERVSVMPRLGLEGELVPGWLQLRGGSYLEPSRFRGVAPRPHGTFGFDVKTFSWDVFGLLDAGTYFRVSSAVDVSRQYFGWTLGAGVWR
jgi:hypothetical protein